MNKTILFDLDGTLTDSGEGIINCVIYALERFGLPVPERETLRYFVGPPLHESFVKQGVPADRAEEAVADHREKFDFATSRAVARLNILLELTAPYVRVGGAVLALKGSAAREELEEAKGAVKKLGLQVESIRDFQFDGATHSVIVLRKVAHTPNQYPRRYAKIKQAPL